jgi:hypothetical protein
LYIIVGAVIAVAAAVLVIFRGKWMKKDDAVPREYQTYRDFDL